MAKRFVKTKNYTSWSGKTAEEKAAYQDSIIFVDDRKLIIEGNADNNGFTEFDGRTVVGGEVITVAELQSASGPYVGQVEVSHGSPLTGTAITPTNGGSVTSGSVDVITSVSKDKFGHVTGATKKSITLPTNTNTTYDLTTTSSTSNGKLNLVAGGSGSGTDTITITGSGTVSVKSDASGNITITGADLYKGDITGVAAGTGLTGGGTSGSVTVSANLKSTTAHTASSATPTNTASRQYAVGVDKDGYLSVNVPWSDTNTDTKLTKVDFTAGTATTPSGNTVDVVSSIPDATGTDGKTVSSTYSMVSVPTKSYVDGLIAASDAMVFKGTIGTGGTITALPSTGKAGWTYKVITAGTYAGQTCQVGDMIIAVKDFTAASNDNWSIIQNNVDLVSGKDTIGLIKNGSTVTSASGYTAAPIINGIPYYKDTTYATRPNPNALVIKGNGTSVENYDGSAAGEVNIVGGGNITVSAADGKITVSGADTYKGTVTSVGMTVPTGLSVTPTSITSNGTFAVSYASGYSIPTTAKQGNWDAAYGWGNHASAGYVKSSGVTSVATGEGLSGGTITSTGTIKLEAAKTDKLGGIKVASVGTAASGANTTINTNKFAVHVDSNGLGYVAIPAYSNNNGDITGVTAGVGLAGGATSGTATVKANLVSETKGSVAAASKLYYNAVGVDVNGKLVVDSSADWAWEVIS